MCVLVSLMYFLVVYNYSRSELILPTRLHSTPLALAIVWVVDIVCGVISAKIKVNYFVCLQITTGASPLAVHPNVINTHIVLYPNENFSFDTTKLLLHYIQMKISHLTLYPNEHCIFSTKCTRSVYVV